MRVRITVHFSPLDDSSGFRSILAYDLLSVNVSLQFSLYGKCKLNVKKV